MSANRRHRRAILWRWPASPLSSEARQDAHDYKQWLSPKVADRYWLIVVLRQWHMNGGPGRLLRLISMRKGSERTARGRRLERERQERWVREKRVRET